MPYAERGANQQKQRRGNADIALSARPACRAGARVHTHRTSAQGRHGCGGSSWRRTETDIVGGLR